MKKALFFAVLLSCTMFVNAQTQLSDGATVGIGDSYMTANFLRAGDVPELKQGTMTYDPTNHVLTLTDVVIETETSAQYGLGIGCVDMPAGSKQMEIRIVGTNIIQSMKQESWALFLGDGDFVISGLNGTLKLMTNSGIGMSVGADELTIRDGAYVYAGYSEPGLQSKIGASVSLFANPIVTIDCATLVSFGTEYSMGGINPGLSKAAEQDGYEYNSSKDAWTEDGTKVLKNKALTFAPTKHIFWWQNATPEGGTITVTKGGNPLPCPYYYSDSEQGALVNIVATPNTNWAFAKWNNYNGSVDDNAASSTTYELPSNQTSLLIASFRNTKPAAPSEPWYLLQNSTNKLYKYTDLTQSPTVAIEDLTATGMTKVAVTQATCVGGKLYYLDQVDGTNVGMNFATFTPDAATPAERITASQALVASQSVYQKFYALTYNPADKHFYAVAKKSDATQYLVKMAADQSTITEVGPIEHSDINNSVGIYLLAANKQGHLYGIFKSAETYNKENSPYRHGSMFCEIDPSTAEITNIGWTGLYFESPSCTMAFDCKTGALIGTNDGGYDKWIFSIDTQTGRATRLGAFVYYNNGLFQLHNGSEAIEQVECEQSPATRKVLRDGQLLIIRDGNTYNAQGASIE